MNGFGRRLRRRGRGRDRYFDDNNKNIIRIALAGNPNSGKTSVFNALTKQRQHIGNYPGVTVEKKSGRIQYDGKVIEFVDLPGTYSLSAYSLEEIVSRDFVLKEKPDVIVDILDSTNLERHLYLLLQFQELGVPIVGALNMSDEAEQKGIVIDKQQLEGILGIPLVKTVGSKGQGVQDLLETAVKVADGEILSNKRHLNYGTRLENAHNDIIRVLSTDPDFVKKYSMHWISIKLLENDRDAVEKVKQEHQNPDGVLLVAANWRQRIESHFGEDSEVVVSEQRYAYIRGATKETVHTKTKKGYINITEKIDRIALNRYLGILVFLVIMFLIYQMTFALGNPVSGSIGAFFGWCSNSLENLLPSGPLLDFLTGGIINGVGGVLVFLPLVLFLFLGLSFLEDTGYMARAAFVMDKFFHIFGLHGRSFIPFMVSSGCAVPGIMSARVLANPRDRIVTIMVSPIMMCGAKIPVIAMLAAAFFPEHAGLVFWSIWLFSWVSALTLALIFRNTLFRGEQTPFVMELPPYRMPTVRGVLYHMWEKSWEYVKKAGTVILTASIIIWFLLSYPKLPEADATITSNLEVVNEQVSSHFEKSHISGNNTAKQELIYSFGGRIGKAIEPVIKYAGFDWKLGVSLFAGIAAKEVIISTMGILYGIEGEQVDEEALDDEIMLKDRIEVDPNYSPLVALSLMVFVMIYIPCIATLVMVKKELGSWKWPLFQAAYTLFVALALSIGIYQVGSLFISGV